MLIAFTIAHIVIHPVIDTGGFSIFGIKFGASDSDNAIDVGIHALFKGHYPYTEKTFLNAPLTPMPGSLLLAIPFYLLGDSSLQSIFWYSIFWLFIWKMTSDIRIASILILIVSFLSPNVLYNICTGSDYIANGIFVLVAIAVLMTSLNKNGYIITGLSIFLGITLSSRPNWLLVLPILFFYIAYNANYRSALKILSITVFSFCLSVLPFYLYDPSHFSPLHVGDFLTIGKNYPHADILVALLAGFFSIGLGYYFKDKPLEFHVRNLFFTQASVIICGLILISLVEGKVNLFYGHFGILFMFFGLFASGPQLIDLAINKDKLSK